MKEIPPMSAILLNPRILKKQHLGHKGELMDSARVTGTLALINDHAGEWDEIRK